MPSARSQQDHGSFRHPSRAGAVYARSFPRRIALPFNRGYFVHSKHADIVRVPCRTGGRVDMRRDVLSSWPQCFGSILGLSLLLLLSGEAIAQPASGARVRALNDVDVVSNPPSGVLCLGGNVVGRIPAGAIVQQSGSTTAYCGPFISKVYLRVTYNSLQGYVAKQGTNGRDQFSTAN